jgi:hypothetical protein
MVQQCDESQCRTSGIMEWGKDGLGLSGMMLILILKRAQSDF